ncbi:hypothetical protein PQE73_gp057 [Bacillus phage vB_BanS_MrDarsey]|uniref:Uncharacterized protein n=1 Tax=Bacillus phage vB_BanS_MrDarsey TaxID=2894787 RepID=A0AAE8YPK5_9CAUD|nr:hypothetical protein PQE73_gp057 [Bacillus phage vB_BanS_MrDarsey]UGO47889.1 hypothetical protein MRDARSEY_57 [Bacillus phage vB_BanS_MrDarsey]
MINETEKISLMYGERLGDYTIEINLMRIFTSKSGFTRYYNEYYDAVIYKKIERKFWFGHRTQKVFAIKWDTNGATLTDMVSLLKARVKEFKSEDIENLRYINM